MTINARDRLEDLLAKLDRELDPIEEDQIHTLHRDALEFKPVDRLPVIVMCTDEQPEHLRPYDFSEAVKDPAKMLFNELVSAYGTSVARRIEIGDDLPATVRSNFGTIMVASCYGARIEQVEENPPWVQHFESRDELRRAIDRGANLKSAEVERAIEFMDFYRDTLADFPRLKGIIKIIIPDLQGPLDNAAMLRGSDLFLEMVTDPEFVALLLSRMSQTQLELWRKFSPLSLNESDGFVHQHGVLVKGNILIRNDSSIMISPEMYEDQVHPHDISVLAGVDGGGIHSCGNLNHLLPIYVRADKVGSIDFGQSRMNDLSSHYGTAAESGVAMMRILADRQELIDGTILERFPTGVSLVYESPSADDARDTLARYRNIAKLRSE